MRGPLSIAVGLALLIAALGAAPAAEAGTREADAAIREMNEGKRAYNVVQNRFFLKSNRFELAPILGYVPNNPMVKRYVGGVLGAYHFSEVMAVEGAFMYAPDLEGNDLKDLTHTLVSISHQENQVGDFQQPLDKMILGATFAVRWAPVYGKINLIGERVLNFDFYGVAGLGLLSIASYYARYDESAGEPPTSLDFAQTKAKGAGNLGVGLDFFMTSSVALKIDARSYLYIDKKPQYDPDVAQNESRLYNNFIASLGVSVYFPKMSPRRTNF